MKPDWETDIPALLRKDILALRLQFNRFGPVRVLSRSAINPQVAQTLAMEAPGSSQWMEPLEPEPEPGAVRPWVAGQ